MRTHLKLFLAIGIITIAVFSSKAQTPADVLKHGSDATFFGIDFSKCKGVMLGATADEMKNNYFPAINTLLVVEEDKYNIKKTLDKSDVTIDLKDVNRLNKTIDVDNFEVTSIKEVAPLSLDTVAKMVGRYNLKDKSGIGLVFIAESLDKIKDIGAYYLVYFSMPDGRVIICEKVTGKPRGFGMRNYWAHTIYDILRVGNSMDSGLQENLEHKYLSKKTK